MKCERFCLSINSSSVMTEYLTHQNQMERKECVDFRENEWWLIFLWTISKISHSEFWVCFPRNCHTTQIQAQLLPDRSKKWASTAAWHKFAQCFYSSSSWRFIFLRILVCMRNYHPVVQQWGSHRDEWCWSTRLFERILYVRQSMWGGLKMINDMSTWKLGWKWVCKWDNNKNLEWEEINSTFAKESKTRFTMKTNFSSISTRESSSRPRENEN